ncbi:MAG: Bug family tripartite tricarboxylate transporter substrate binding protein [Burkholderiales bacterium]
MKRIALDKGAARATALLGVVASVLFALATPFSPTVFAQSYPTKPISIVSSASPGTSGDAALRMMTAKMSASMGQPIVVELRTAARGAQAYAVVSKAAPDGHTLTFGTAGTFVYGRFLFKNMAFDILKDYTPVSMSLNSPAYVAIHNSRGINTMQELIDYAKKNPGKLEFGSTGNGSYFHLAGEALKHAAGVDMLHVPYSQANYPQLQTDFLNGRIAVFVTTWFTVGPNQNRVKTLAVVDRQRSRHLPNVPIVSDLLPAYEPFVVWWGFFGPVGLPNSIATRVAAESKAAMLQADVLTRIEDLGMEVVGSTPDELARMLRQDVEAIGKVVKAIGLQPE